MRDSTDWSLNETFNMAIGTFPAERNVNRLFNVKFQRTDRTSAIRYFGQ